MNTTEADLDVIAAVAAACEMGRLAGHDLRYAVWKRDDASEEPELVVYCCEPNCLAVAGAVRKGNARHGEFVALEVITPVAKGWPVPWRSHETND